MRSAAHGVTKKTPCAAHRKREKGARFVAESVATSRRNGSCSITCHSARRAEIAVKWLLRCNRSPQNNLFPPPQSRDRVTRSQSALVLVRQATALNAPRFRQFNCFEPYRLKMLREPNSRPDSLEPSAQERRKDARYPFTAAADVTDLQSGARVVARSSDLGRGGCFIDTISPFPIGTGVRLRLTFEGTTFETRANVRYAQSGMGMGLAFLSVEPDQLWTLQKWLGALTGDLPPEMSASESEGPAALKPPSDAEPRFVLNELIITLVRKRVLTEAEGKALLRKLMS